MNQVAVSLQIPAPHGREAACRPTPVERLWCCLMTGVQRHRQRRALARLDGRLRRDIGITRAQAEAEAGKPFWRA